MIWINTGDMPSLSPPPLPPYREYPGEMDGGGGLGGVILG